MTLRAALVALLFTFLGAGVAAGIMQWEPWEGNGGSDLSLPSPTLIPMAEPTPTLYQRRFTGAEAAAIVKQKVTAAYNRPASDAIKEGREPDFVAGVEECRPSDFNELLKVWVVECRTTWSTAEVRARPGWREFETNETFRMYEVTSKVEKVGGAPLVPLD